MRRPQRDVTCRGDHIEKGAVVLAFVGTHIIANPFFHKRGGHEVLWRLLEYGFHEAVEWVELLWAQEAASTKLPKLRGEK